VPAKNMIKVILLSISLGFIVNVVSAQQTFSPENLEFRTAKIISEGVRLNAEIFSPKSLAGKSLPAIIMAHGWGARRSIFDAMQWNWRTPVIWLSPSITAAGGRAKGASS
jgi:hypothetical protein